MSTAHSVARLAADMFNADAEDRDAATARLRDAVSEWQRARQGEAVARGRADRR